jgi:putative FmdB family regulatory protein
MPLYPFVCDDCGLEFDVSRQPEDSDRPADCPLDGAEARRAKTTAPMRRADGTEVMRRGTPLWTALMHDHGPGTLPHPHGPGTPFHRS